jgi:xylulokinase
MIGGGAKSPLWMQMFADVTGKTFRGVNRKDVSMWGAALLAGNAIGVFDDIKAVAKKHIAPVAEYKPDPSLASKYQKHMQMYKEKLSDLRPFYKQLQDIQK